MVRVILSKFLGWMLGYWTQPVSVHNINLVDFFCCGKVWSSVLQSALLVIAAGLCQFPAWLCFFRDCFCYWPFVCAWYELKLNSIWIESSVEVLASILHYQRFHLQGAASYCLLRLIRGIADWLSREVGVKGVTTKLCSFKAFNFMPHVLAGCVVYPIRPLSIDLVDYMCR